MKAKIQHKNQLQEPLDSNYLSFTIESITQLEDSICEELYIGNVLDYVTNRTEMLVMLTKKIRYNGTIIINGFDIYTIALQLADGTLDSHKAAELLYGGKMSGSTVEDMCSLLKQCGLEITNTNPSQYIYSITAKRPSIR